MTEYFNNLVTDPVALLGLLASIIVLVSMCFNTRSRNGELLMRSLNLVGSIVSVVYGMLIGVLGAGMVLLNGVLVFVNAFYLLKNIKQSSVVIVDKTTEILYNNDIETTEKIGG